ncbi:MAG: sulfotransferase family protein [Bryobacterales bacterium]|nr:sulfotransferase family protein [Acidobacteriota bacterium]MCB9383789.1 sulfotransferase family protein [Bryobacterales bacterium]
MTQETKRICVWSGPRNISTALLYSFGERDDTRVADEPLYGFYLAESGAEHPGYDELRAKLDPDGERVVREVILGPCDRKVLFLKQMAHHLTGSLDWEFLKQTVNVLLVRDPEQMLPSLDVQVPQPTMRDAGYDKLAQILDYCEAAGQQVPVLDSRDLQNEAERVLRALCEQLGIGWDPAMLAWPAGPKPYDGPWAPYWYHNVHKSTGFTPYKAKTAPFPERLRPLLDECAPIYERLSRLAIR